MAGLGDYTKGKKFTLKSGNVDLHHKSDGSVVKMSTSNNRNVWKHGER